MCKKSFEEIKVLVEGQVSCTFDAKIFAIVLNVNKASLPHHLFNENGEGPMEFFQGEKFDKVMDKFEPFYSPNIWNLIASFKHNASTKAPWITYLSLSQKVLMITSKIVISLDKWLGKRCFCLKCHYMGQQARLIW
jgi:hypothetical protein